MRRCPLFAGRAARGDGLEGLGDVGGAQVAASRDDSSDLAGRPDVVQRVRFEEHEVGPVSGRDNSEISGDSSTASNVLGDDPGSGLQHFVGVMPAST